MTDREAETEALGGGFGATFDLRGATLEVVRGEDAGRYAHIAQPTFVIGSGPSADLRLSDSAVSREHVRLLPLATGMQVRDEGSKNGTWVGGIRIDRATFTSDATLTLGSTAVLLRLDAGAIALPLSTSGTFGGALGRSVAMRHLFALLERAAGSDVTVLLEGETGVGKEVLARAIHQHSARKDGPFVAVDCGAIPPALLESELFGHQRGAFTGATHDRDGMFVQANGGTLFLDEIGELPLEMQPKLLRVLEQREVRPVGASAPRAIDVRILAATNRRLAEASRRDEFRRDLYYRLAVARVTVPPLRDRAEDIVHLGNVFLQRLTGNKDASLSPEMAAMLTAYAWPGNVRELRNVVERFALLDVRDARTLFDESLAVGGTTDLSHLEFHEARRIAIDRFEEAYVEKLLGRAGGAVARAAELSGVARATFYRMVERVRAAKGE